jgi:hypothetical protein
MRIIKYCAILFVLISFYSCTASETSEQEQFSFILAADWRYTATAEYDSPIYFRGALDAIEKVGKGAFMISPGDVEPVKDSREMIAEVLGQEYPWYPIMGNHELEHAPTMDYLRELNKGGMILPYIVNKGPVGCEETTFSFDYGNAHFVVLNQYYDGVSDVGTDGDVVDALYTWLENDLKSTQKTHIFVSGHEPIISIPDMDNGRHRHIGDSLDKYPRKSFRFHQLLLEHNVVAYLHGHTHSTSYSNINGLWQVDCGHARGTESEFPEKVMGDINNWATSTQNIDLPIEAVLRTFYEKRSYELKKVMYYMNMTDGVSYKKLPDEKGFEILQEFYKQALSLGTETAEYFKTYYDNWSVNRSTFMNFKVYDDHIAVDIYRNTLQDPAHYEITQSFQL